MKCVPFGYFYFLNGNVCSFSPVRFVRNGFKINFGHVPLFHNNMPASSMVCGFEVIIHVNSNEGP